MKATLSTLLLCVSAIAVADPVADPVAEPKKFIHVTPGKAHYQGRLNFCGVPGSFCHRMKRSAEAIAHAFAEADPEARYQGRFGFCGIAGSSCHKARRSIENIGELAERSYGDVLAREAQPDPEADAKAIQKANGKFGFCGPRGINCKRDAEAEAKIQVAKGKFGFCGPRGINCKRDAEAEAEPKIQVATGKFGFCGPRGINCKRDAEAEAELKIQVAKGKFGFCGPRGINCKRDAEPTQVAHGSFGFCGVRGMNCAMVKRDPRYQGRFGFCGVAGSGCKRDADAEAVANIARSIQEWDPSYLTETCLEEGGECASLVKARDAFMEIKRDTEHLHAKRAEEDVHADAKRAAEEEDITETLDELEAALHEAVARI